MTRHDTYDQLYYLVQAGARVVHLASYEWERVRAMARALQRDLELPLYVWSRVAGLRRHTRDGFQLEDAGLGDPQELLREFTQRADGVLDERCILLAEDFHPFFEYPEVVAWVREATRIPREPRRVLLLATTAVSLPDDLSKDVATVELPLPDDEDLEQVLRRVARYTDLPLDERAVPVLVDAARGLTVMEAERAFGRAAVEGGALGFTAVPRVAAEKKSVIRRIPALSYVEPSATLEDVGGLESLKAWLERRHRAFEPEARDFGVEAPRGVLLLGVPGGGKSLVAQVIAYTWRLPLLRFDAGAIFEGIVGQSEANVRRALHVAEALAPCVVWIDEIEKGLAGVGSSGSTDGGTAARVVGTLLSWMQDRTAPVFVVATANRLDMLPPELLRKGRFDELFFVDLPNAEEREAIFSVHLRRRGRSPHDFDLDRLVRASRGFTGAEIEQAVREALVDAWTEGRELDDDAIVRAIESTTPLSLTMAEQIEALRKWARVRARRASAGDPEPLDAAGRTSVPILPQEDVDIFAPSRPRQGGRTRDRV